MTAAYHAGSISHSDSLGHRAGVFDKCSGFKRAQELIREGLYPYFHVIESAQEPEVVCEGRVLTMLSSNNYLGLTSDRRVKQAALDAVHRYGTGCSGSRFLNGSLNLHETLEHRMAEFLGKSAAVLFPTGYQANLGTIAALAGKGDRVVIDRMNHASIYDGSRMAYARIRKYTHNDMADLARVLASGEGHNALVVADGVFSMEGDIADLPGLVDVCRRYGAGLMLDEAHALGVLGESGRGTGEHYGLTPEVDLIMTTFSKSLATVGGCLAGDRDVIEYLKHHARPLIFSASLPPASTAAALAALDIIEEEPERLGRLWRNARYLSEGFRSLGFDTGTSSTPVIPVRINDESRIFQVWRRLFDEGVFTSPVLPPAVPVGTALIRTSCMATHTVDQLDQALDAFSFVGRELNLI